MIRFRFRGSSRHPEPIAFIGLMEGNIAMLRAGKPIRVLPGDPLGLGVELVIYYGKTEVDMTAELEKHEFMPPGSTEKVREAIERRAEFRHEGGA